MSSKKPIEILISESEVINLILVPTKSKSLEKKQKAYLRYMQDHRIANIESLEFTRLNCDIPTELHTWLNVYARSKLEYTSMTEIVIDLLGKFAKERGFKIKNNGC